LDGGQGIVGLGLARVVGLAEGALDAVVPVTRAAAVAVAPSPA
jgi:hypothetical protein